MSFLDNYLPARKVRQIREHQEKMMHPEPKPEYRLSLTQGEIGALLVMIQYAQTHASMVFMSPVTAYQFTETLKQKVSAALAKGDDDGR